MSTENKKSRWIRLEIAFNKGNYPETATLRKDWREKSNKKGGLGKLDKTPDSKEENAKKSDANAFAEKPSLSKRSPVAVPSFWEQARRSKADAAAQKRVESTLKSLKSARLSKSPLEAKEFPFPKRPRTYRSSDPPRRFDDPRKRERE